MKLGIMQETRLRLDDSVLETIDATARDRYPYEACGVLVGRSTPQAIVVERAAPAANLVVERPNDRYLLDPDDFHTADLAARRDGLDIVGIWHTHPDHPAQPSSTDLEAAWPGYTYLIVSLTAEGVEERRAWRLAEGRFIEQHIEENKACQT